MHSTHTVSALWVTAQFSPLPFLSWREKAMWRSASGQCAAPPQSCICWSSASSQRSGSTPSYRGFHPSLSHCPGGWAVKPRSCNGLQCCSPSYRRGFATNPQTSPCCGGRFQPPSWRPNAWMSCSVSLLLRGSSPLQSGARRRSRRHNRANRPTPARPFIVTSTSIATQVFSTFLALLETSVRQ